MLYLLNVVEAKIIKFGSGFSQKGSCSVSPVGTVITINVLRSMLLKNRTSYLLIESDNTIVSINQERADFSILFH